MRFAFGILAITLVVALDSVESASGSGYSRERAMELSDSDDDDIPLNRRTSNFPREPVPMPDNFIRYPFPYYYDEHGVIRDFMNPGSEGIVMHNMLIGMRRANGQRETLTRNGREYFVDLNARQVIFQPAANHHAPPNRQPTTVLRPRATLQPRPAVDYPSFSGQGHHRNPSHPSTNNGPSNNGPI